MPNRSGQQVMSEPFDLSKVKTTAQEPTGEPTQQRAFGLKEAPTFYPTAEEFLDPLAYIEKISVEGSKFGIAKIIPPSDYKPEFSLKTENFRFKTRIQKLNSMEGETRSNMNYLEQLNKYHIITGKPIAKIPQLDKRPIDLYKLKNEVASRGGVQEVTKSKKWAEIGRLLGYARKNCTSMSNALKSAYSKIVLPFEIWFAQHKEDADNLLQRKDIPLMNDDINDTCEICRKAKDEAQLLLCDGCNRGYHMYCLSPPLNSIPKTDWYCLQCLTAVGKDYGFEDGPEYNLTEFQAFSEKFKKEWFSQSDGFVSERDCEKEFWRLANNPHETCQVEYGADLHSTQHGSGFVAPEQMSSSVFDPWNLNVIPVSPQSLFTHIKTDISGMMVPWLYIGMCFSAFCWHNEDHYTYSINYMHWGETKTWYGVPGSDTAKFEDTMKKAMPELFKQQPDLLFQLVTMFSPERLLNESVQVYAADQRPGQFVVTFPKAYHSGFNHGFNFCEAVNFAPLNWIDYGLECVQRYKEFRRQPCFSHDELLVTAAQNLKPCYKSDIEWLKAGLMEMQAREMAQRDTVRVRKLKEVILSEDSSRQEMQCDHCHCYTYLSYIGCVCTDKVSCSEHTFQLCNCPTYAKTFYLRLSDSQLEDLVKATMDSGYIPDRWMEKLSQVMDHNPSLKVLGDLLKEGEELGIEQESLVTLRDFMEVMDRWMAEADRILNWKTDTIKPTSKGRIEKIQTLLQESAHIAYKFPQEPALKEYLEKLLDYDSSITDWLLTSNDKEAQYPIYEQGKLLRADSKRFAKLRGVIESYSWVADVERALSEPYNARTIKKLIKDASDLGIDEGPWPKRLVAIEQEAKRSLQYIENLCRGRQKIELGDEQAVFSIGQNKENPYLSFTLEAHVLGRFQNAISRSQVVLNDVNEMLTLQCTQPNVLERPSYADGQKLMSACREIVFKSENVRSLQQALSSMSTWTELVRNTFMHGRQKSLEHVLRESLLNVENITMNHDKPDLYCICRRPESGLMVACDTCKEWYHSQCVKVPRSVARSSMSYVCPICDRDPNKTLAHTSRRPTLDEIQQLMDKAQQLKFCPKDYSMIQSIYNHMTSFRSQMQSFCYSYMTVQDIGNVERYLRCLEGLEVQLPNEVQHLVSKLQSLVKASPAFNETSVAGSSRQHKERKHISHKLSISSLLHKTEPVYPISYDVYKQDSPAVQSNINHQPQTVEPINTHSSRVVLKTGGIKRPAEEALPSSRIQKVKLTVRPPVPPSQSFQSNKKRSHTEEEKPRVKKQKSFD